MLDARYSSNEIYDAVQRSLFDEDFREQCRKAKNPYWLGEAGPKIAEILANVSLDQDLIRKRMTIKGEIKDGWHR